MYRIVCEWQAYNDGKKTTFESALTLVLEGYETTKSLGTTALFG